MNINFVEVLATFMVLFAIIDILGSIPIILDIKNKTGTLRPGRITLVAFLIMLGFLFIGDSLLSIFGIDVSSFAVAGSIIIFLLGIEMVLGIELFKHEEGGGTIVPIAFPLIAGAGSITTLLSLKAEYHTINILIALILNMAFVFLVLRLAGFFEKLLGPGGLRIIRNFFGIILLAIAVKLFTANVGLNLSK